MRCSSEMPFKIVAFGNDALCRDVEELEHRLMSEYQNRSVAIHYRTASTGIIGMVFVNVESDAVRETYGERSVVDFSKISSAAEV